MLVFHEGGKARKSTKHRRGLGKPYRVLLRWDRSPTLSKRTGLERVLMRAVSEGINPTRRHEEPNDKECSKVGRFQLKNQRGRQIFTGSIFFDLSMKEPARHSGKTENSVSFLHQSVGDNCCCSRGAHAGSWSRQSAARRIPSRTAKAPMTDRSQ